MAASSVLVIDLANTTTGGVRIQLRWLDIISIGAAGDHMRSNCCVCACICAWLLLVQLCIAGVCVGLYMHFNMLQAASRFA
jgi:hypothetical protein